MNPGVAQFGPDVLEWALTIALVAGGLLLVGGLVSFAVFLYRSVKGDGMRDPEEVVPEKFEDDELTEGDSDDEWEYY